MAMDIRKLVSRRTDLSTFVVHLTRQRDEQWTAPRALYRIAELCVVHAITPMGWAASQNLDEAGRRSQRVVCFSETPLEHIDMLVAEIAGRQIKLQPWGVVVTKMTARANGVNPVWYVDMTPGRDWEIAAALDRLREDAIQSGFANHPAATILPFFEPMGTWRGTRREFWWEREWRKRGDFSFHPEDVVAWIVPEEDQPAFQEYMADEWGPRPARCIDASWSLEEIIAKLTDQSPINPFG
jgi:hypothetical protein